MEKSTFIYDDGTWGIEKRTYVEVNNYYDDPLHNWNEVDYLEIVPKGFPMLKIPKSHIVEIDFITSDTTEKKSKLLRGLIGLAVTTAGMATPLALLGAPMLLTTKCLAVFKEVLFVGAGIGALTGIGTKTVKENFCIISYLDENAPEDLKIIVLDANASVGNSFVKDRQKFVENLQTQVRRINKADCVKAFMQAVDSVLEAQENEFNEQDKQRNAMLENSSCEIDGFIFKAENIHSITGRGIVGTGKVSTGSINVNDEVYLVKPSGMAQKCYVTIIEQFRCEIQTAQKGDSIGILLNPTGKYTLEVGDIICTSDVIETCKLIATGIISFQHIMETYASSFYADIKVSDVSIGGNKPLLEGTEYAFSFGTKVFKGTMRFPADKNSKLLPNVEDAVIVDLENPIFIRKDFEFSISNGNTLKAQGVVSEICND